MGATADVGLAGRAGGGVEMITVAAVGVGNGTGCAGVGSGTGVGEGTGLTSGVETVAGGATAGVRPVSEAGVTGGPPQATSATIHGAIRNAAALSRVPIEIP